MATQHHAPKSAERQSIDDVLARDEQRLILEALRDLQQRRVRALMEARRVPMSRAQPYTERDFGIPQIKRLLRRLGHD